LPTSVPTSASNGDLPETGLQGEVSLADQLSGRSLLGYRRGLKLIGQNTIGNRGANLQLAWSGNCAYVGQAQASRFFPGVDTTPPTYPAGEVSSYGIAVIDATDDTNPALLHILQSPATYNMWEALHTNTARNFLAVSGTSTKLDLYDITDCKNPTLLSDTTLPATSHGMLISPDGNTVYIADLYGSQIEVVDVSNLRAPKLMMLVPEPGAHDLDISDDGTRVYLAAPGNGVLVIDVSSIQNRSPNPTAKTIGKLPWPELSHTARRMQNGGRTYLMDSDEVNGTGMDRFGHSFGTGLGPPSDDVGTCPWGFGRIVDITSETNPALVSTYGLQVNDAVNCPTTIKDVESESYQLVNYSPHYGGFDNKENAELAFWTWYSSGLRVFNISNPADPVEIAYYNPPPIPTVTNNEFILGPSPLLYDYSTSYTRYMPSNGDIWFVSEQNGFQILRLTNTAGPKTYPQARPLFGAPRRRRS